MVRVNLRLPIAYAVLVVVLALPARADTASNAEVTTGAPLDETTSATAKEQQVQLLRLIDQRKGLEDSEACFFLYDQQRREFVPRCESAK